MYIVYPSDGLDEANTFLDFVLYWDGAKSGFAKGENDCDNENTSM